MVVTVDVLRQGSMAESIDANRNIVLISVDSLRADYCYDAEVPTPTMDAIAESGVKYENAIAPGPATYESMPAIFTGTQPGVSGERGGINQRDRIATHLRAHKPLPARLRERGYTTVGVSPNPFTSRQFGFDTGFDRFVDFLDSTGFGGRIRQRIVSRWSNDDFVGGLRFGINMLGLGDVSVDCSEVVSSALSEIANVSEPFFLWLMFLDPHWPYRPPSGYRERTGPLDWYRANWRASNFSDSTPTGRDTETLERLYRGTIRSVDDCLATLRTELDSYDPIYVLHADHGEGFGEHGRFGHGALLYEENVRVPLLVGNVDVAASVEAPVSLRHVPALVTGLSDGEFAFRPDDLDLTYATSENGALCVRGPWWKYYVRADDTGSFFDLRTDPNERAGAEAVIDELEELYRARISEVSRVQSAAQDRLPLQRL